MNYQPVVAQSNDFSGTKASNGAEKEKEPERDYILLPLWTADSPFSATSKSSQDNEFQPSNDGDDDTFNFSMRSLLRPASWLGSHTESAIAAMAGLRSRFLIFVSVSELRVERDTYAFELVGDQWGLWVRQQQWQHNAPPPGDDRVVIMPPVQSAPQPSLRPPCMNSSGGSGSNYSGGEW
nr:hypothetical protein [Tanacetum cinerariifolium]